jgi:hypothetical protein
MKRLAGVILLAAAGLSAAQPEKARVPRATMVKLEQAFDAKVSKISATDPMEVLSSTQGVYLEGFGAVFTVQLDLIMTPAINPFRQVMTKPEIARVRARKIERLPVLKLIMREMLMETAAGLPEMPANENVVLAVTLFRVRWEDTEGLPAQIVMQAPKQKLISRAAADSAIQLQEF